MVNTKNNSEINNSIRTRLKLVYLLSVFFGISVLFKLFYIQTSESGKWIKKFNKKSIKKISVEAARGNIFATDGTLLSTTVPVYELIFEPSCKNIDDKTFNDSIPFLAEALSALYNKKTKFEYIAELKRARKKKSNYYLIAREASYEEFKKIKTFPILNRGLHKGGFVHFKKNKRKMTYTNLAYRTIGKCDESKKQLLGIEKYYDGYLKGIDGVRLMNKIAANVYLPLNEYNQIDPKDGNDVVSTIDIKIQDVAHHALERKLIQEKAEKGCLILMEVKSGEIKAMVNLSRSASDSAKYIESLNYAIGYSSEPGSTFKLPSLMTLLEKDAENYNENVNRGNGSWTIHGHTIKDSHTGGKELLTFKEVFEESSNVGTAKLLHKHFSKRPQEFIDYLYKMGINRKTNIDLPNEVSPEIKNTKDKFWSAISLPQMSYGYEIKLTPLQILNFYSAVANNGKMMRPRLVKEIKDKKNVIKKFEPEVLIEKIASEQTIKYAKEMLEGVVENGTATNLKNSYYKIAAKTGTAQIAMGSEGYERQGKKSYQASLCGYFPAKEPMYSMIIVVYNPSKKAYYGNEVAGPVFREVADKVYSSSIEMHNNISEDTAAVFSKIPILKNGNADDINTIAKKLGIKTFCNENSTWVNAKPIDKKIHLYALSENSKSIPNVVGMGLKDALFILENKKYYVKVKGKGTVKRQSLINEKDKKTILIELS